VKKLARLLRFEFLDTTHSNRMPATNDSSVRNRLPQQKDVQQFREHADADLFFNVLTDDGMLDKLESLLPEHRERLYTPTQTCPCSLLKP